MCVCQADKAADPAVSVPAWHSALPHRRSAPVAAVLPWALPLFQTASGNRQFACYKRVAAKFPFSHLVPVSTVRPVTAVKGLYLAYIHSYFPSALLIQEFMEVFMDGKTPQSTMKGVTAVGQNPCSAQYTYRDLEHILLKSQGTDQT